MESIIKRKTEYLLAKKVVETSLASNEDFVLNNFTDQVYLENENYFLLKKGGFVVLDFGKEIAGGIRLITARSSSTIRIRFGESCTEAYSELDENKAGNYHSLRDFKVDIPYLSDMSFGNTGFRFVRIDNIGNEDLMFVSILGAYTHIEENIIGSFECDDKDINTIFNTAAYTLYLCMQSRLWDGIKRDRLVWLGDMHPESKGIYNLFGDHKLLEVCLKEIILNTQSNKWINNIPSYSVWWLIVLSEYDFRCDKWDFVKTLIDSGNIIIDRLLKSIDENGNLDFIDGKTQFINWETSNDPALNCANRGLVLYAARSYQNLLESHGIVNKKVSDLISRLEKNTFFDGKTKAIAVIYALGYGYTDEVKKILLDGKVDGFSTFMSYYIASGIKDCGDSKLSLSLLKEFYMGMVSRGATSFWESFDLSWLKGSSRIDCLPKEGELDLHSSFGSNCYSGLRLSLCHGWSCGPVHFLMDNALGVKFVERGGKKIKIEPDLMGLKYAKGKVPTKYGIIEIENTMTDKGIVTKYKLPKGVKVVKD